MRRLKIGTHDGIFHCDDALACFMLRKLPEYKDAEIVRSRDQNILDTCDIVVDVGGVYDHSKKLYDHHQRTFNETLGSLRPNVVSKVKLSSAGLIFHHYGERIMKAILGKEVNDKTMELMHRHVYDTFIKEIDAVDNGVPMYEVGEPLYNFNTNLSARVTRLLPKWNSAIYLQDITIPLFEQAMQLTGAEMEHFVYDFNDVFWPARETVQSAVDDRFNIDPSGAILEIQSCPWKQHLFNIEKEQGLDDKIKFVVFGDSSSWRIAAIPLTPGNFILRLPLHPSWQGLRDQELAAATGVKDAVFVHSTGFIGGAKTREGALEMAKKCIALYDANNSS